MWKETHLAWIRWQKKWKDANWNIRLNSDNNADADDLVQSKRFKTGHSSQPERDSDSRVVHRLTSSLRWKKAPQHRRKVINAARLADHLDIPLVLSPTRAI